MGLRGSQWATCGTSRQCWQERGDDLEPQVLLVALRITHSGEERRLLRFPFFAFVLHLAAVAMRHAAVRHSESHRFFGSVALFFLLLSIGRSSVLLVVDIVIGRRFASPVSKITRDIVQGLVYAGVGVATLRADGVEPGSLLTTSALLTAVVGLSLQETLGNLFVGLGIQAQRPFDVGDWIQFDADPRHIGRITEINWRATKLVTLDEIELTVPNGTLAKAPIANYSKPTTHSRRSVYVHTRYEVPPAKVQETILAAIADAPGVLREPPSSVVTNQFADNGVEYLVRFFTDQFHRRDGIDGGVRDRIWYALRRADIAIPYPSHGVDVRQLDDATHLRAEQRRAEEVDRSLRCVDFFQVLGDEDIRSLATMTRQRLFAPGEMVVRQGDDSKELYVSERGEVVVQISRTGGGTVFEVARLGAGKFFCEMALATGDSRQANVQATAHSTLLEVPQSALQRIFEKSPQLAERMSKVFAKRQAELDARSASLPPPSQVEVSERTSQLLGKIRRVFSL